MLSRRVDRPNWTPCTFKALCKAPLADRKQPQKNKHSNKTCPCSAGNEKGTASYKLTNHPFPMASFLRESPKTVLSTELQLSASIPGVQRVAGAAPHARLAADALLAAAGGLSPMAGRVPMQEPRTMRRGRPKII